MSTARTTYTATAPNGQTFTRKSARTITHAVLSQREDGTHGWISFNGSASLAAKSADAYAFLNPIIVPVTAS